MLMRFARTSEGKCTECAYDETKASSITYPIAVEPQLGRKELTIKTLPDCESDNPFVST